MSASRALPSAREVAKRRQGITQVEGNKRRREFLRTGGLRSVEEALHACRHDARLREVFRLCCKDRRKFPTSMSLGLKRSSSAMAATKPPEPATVATPFRQWLGSLSHWQGAANPESIEQWSASPACAETHAGLGSLSTHRGRNDLLDRGFCCKSTLTQPATQHRAADRITVAQAPEQTDDDARRHGASHAFKRLSLHVQPSSAPSLSNRWKLSCARRTPTRCPGTTCR